MWNVLTWLSQTLELNPSEHAFHFLNRTLMGEGRETLNKAEPCGIFSAINMQMLCDTGSFKARIIFNPCSL